MKLGTAGGFILCLLFCSTVPDVLLAQENTTVKPVQQAYDQFDYARTVQLAQQLLTGKDSLSNNERVAVFTLKGVAEYSLAHEDSARSSFLSVLSLDPTNALDPIAYSPKIIEFFDQVKKEFAVLSHPVQPTTQRNLLSETSDHASNGVLSTSLAKSLVFPGWGQLSTEGPGESTKGWLFASAAVASLASSIYFIVQTNKRENDYLAQSDRAAISAAYDDYNSAYTKRNISVIAFAAIWTAAQVDLIYFPPSPGAGTFGLELNPKIDQRTLLFSPVFSARYNF